MTRTLRPLAALAVAALIATGCSKAPAGTDTAGTTADERSSTSVGTSGQAVRFSQCMRANGVPGFPDPDASGQLTIDAVVNGSSLNPDSSAWKRAVDVCKDLEPSGFTGHKRTAKQQAAALEFARCMRENGVPDFVDPPPDGPLINIDGSKPGLKDAVHAAGQKCRDLATAAGVTGGR